MKSKNITLVLILTFLLVTTMIPFSPFVSELASADWYNSGWDYRKEITINHNKIDATLKNFPMLVSLTTDSDLEANAQDDFDDILFTNATGTKLNHEIERYNSGTGELIAWVNVTSISDSVDTTIYMYYGNSGCSNQQDVHGTWDSNYIAVYHMNESTGNCIDSTANGNDGTFAGDLPDRRTGKIGYAQHFDGTGDWIVLPAAAFAIGSAGTVESWIKQDGGTNLDFWFHVYEDDPKWEISCHIPANPDTWYNVRVGNGDKVEFIKGTKSTDWECMAIRWETDDVNLLQNGAEVGADTSAVMHDSFDPDKFYIGARSEGTTHPMEGIIEEFRVSNMQRSDAWLSASYYTIAISGPAAGEFISALGSEENAPENTAPNTPTALGPTARQTSTSVTIYCTVTDPDADSMNVSFYDNSDDSLIGTDINVVNNTQASMSWNNLVRGTTYTFYARSSDGTLESANSSTESFDVNALPTATSLETGNATNPVRTIDFTPYFDWTYADGDTDTQTNYQIQVGTTENSSNLWDSSSVSSSNTFAIYDGSALSRGVRYYVRVRVYDGYEWSDW